MSTPGIDDAALDPSASDSSTPYGAWVTATINLGGAAVAWPFSDQYNGLAAARFPSAQYVTIANAQLIDNTLPVRAANSNKFVYVLAPQTVQDASPKTMTAWQRFLNAGFTFGDAASDALGLPSLNTMKNVLGMPLEWVKYAAIATVVIVAVIVVVRVKSLVDG